jgi:hypothetical protein
MHWTISPLKEVPDVGLMMLSVARLHNLSVLMPRSIPWYGPGKPYYAVRKICDGEAGRGLLFEAEGFRHPGELGHGFGSQFPHHAAAMHLDGDFADRELLGDLLVHEP